VAPQGAILSESQRNARIKNIKNNTLNTRKKRKISPFFNRDELHHSLNP
jgi:hypothetical protein